MNADESLPSKAIEWIRRYLPNEIAGTTVEMGAAAICFSMTDSLALAAVVASIGASVGYYAAAFCSAVRLAYRTEADRGPLARALVASGLALRSVLVEFGPAELVDSVVVRPVAFYLAPLAFGNVVAGWIFAKLVADVAFYAIAIFSYERFTSLLVVREEVLDGSHPAVAAA